jgi:hypothetical protein
MVGGDVSAPVVAELDAQGNFSTELAAGRWLLTWQIGSDRSVPREVVIPVEESGPLDLDFGDFPPAAEAVEPGEKPPGPRDAAVPGSPGKS